MNKPLKTNIGFYNSRNCNTGLERNSIKIMAGLKKKGMNLLLFSPTETYMVKEALKRGIKCIATEDSGNYVNLALSRRLAKTLKAHNCSVLVVVRPHDIVTAVLVKTLFMKKLRLVFFQQIRLALNKSPFIYSLLFSRFDRWIINMDYMATQIRAFSHLKESQIIHIPPCIEPVDDLSNLPAPEARKKTGLPQGSFFIGSQHQFLPKNKLDFLIRAVQFLNRHNYQVSLFLMGKAQTTEEIEYFEFLRDITKECRLNGKVFFSTKTEVQKYFYRAIDIYTETRDEYPYNSHIINSLVHGTPVLAPFTANNTEILQNASLGFLYEEQNIEDFAAKIIRLYTHNKIRDHLIMTGKSYAMKNYSLDNCSTKFERVVSGLT